MCQFASVVCCQIPDHTTRAIAGTYGWITPHRRCLRRHLTDPSSCCNAASAFDPRTPFETHGGMTPPLSRQSRDRDRPVQSAIHRSSKKRESGVPAGAEYHPGRTHRIRGRRCRVDLEPSSWPGRSPRTARRSGSAVDRLLARGGISRQAGGQLKTGRRRSQTLGDHSEETSSARRNRIGRGRHYRTHETPTFERPDDVVERLHHLRP